MGGQKFQYDESGGTFFYFLLSFLALLLIPGTYYWWLRKRKQDPEKLVKACQCDDCKKKKVILQSSEPWKGTKQFLTKLLIISGWIILALLAYKVSQFDYEYANFDPYEILGVPLFYSTQQCTHQEPHDHRSKKMGNILTWGLTMQMEAETGGVPAADFMYINSKSMHGKLVYLRCSVHSLSFFSTSTVVTVRRLRLHFRDVIDEPRSFDVTALVLNKERFPKLEDSELDFKNKGRICVDAGHALESRHSLKNLHSLTVNGPHVHMSSSQ